MDADAIAVSAGLSRLHLLAGRVETAVSEGATIVEQIARKGVWLWATDIAPFYVDALIAAGELSLAEEFVTRFETGLASGEAPAPTAALVTCRGLLLAASGETEMASERFVVAAAAWAALPRPYDELLTLERHGRCLVLAGRLSCALPLLLDAEKRLRVLGATWDADRVAHLLEEHGVETLRAPRRGRRGYGQQLSPRELEVIQLVALGMTNRQIAERLFLSPKTVDRHLGSVKRKLDASTRVGAAMAAVEAGLLKQSTGRPPR